MECGTANALPYRVLAVCLNHPWGLLADLAFSYDSFADQNLGMLQLREANNTNYGTSPMSQPRPLPSETQSGSSTFAAYLPQRSTFEGLSDVECCTPEPCPYYRIQLLSTCEAITDTHHSTTTQVALVKPPQFDQQVCALKRLLRTLVCKSTLNRCCMRYYSGACKLRILVSLSDLVLSAPRMFPTQFMYFVILNSSFS